MGMPAWERYIGLPILMLHDKLYKATDGRIGHTIPFGPPALILHTVGAKTGLARANSLTYARDGADYEPHWEAWARSEAEVLARDRTPERADLVVDGASGEVSPAGR